MSTAEEGPVSTIDFEGLSIEYDDRVLEPRLWTAMQSRWAVELLSQGADGSGDQSGSGARDGVADVLELCAGAGHIGLLVAAESGRRLVAVDIDPVACAFALGNAERAGLLDRVEVRCGPMTETVGAGERFAVVVADPPWVTSEELVSYPEDPLQAIDGGIDGLSVARDCVEVATRHLEPTGSMLVQLGTEEQCDQLAQEAGPALQETGRRQGERGWILRLQPSEQS